MNWAARGLCPDDKYSVAPGTTDETLHVVDNLILPILEDFKPDFIVNSAGQDNHFQTPAA